MGPISPPPAALPVPGCSTPFSAPGEIGDMPQALRWRAGPWFPRQWMTRPWTGCWPSGQRKPGQLADSGSAQEAAQASTSQVRTLDGREATVPAATHRPPAVAALLRNAHGKGNYEVSSPDRSRRPPVSDRPLPEDEGRPAPPGQLQGGAVRGVETGAGAGRGPPPPGAGARQGRGRRTGRPAGWITLTPAGTEEAERLLTRWCRRKAKGRGFPYKVVGWLWDRFASFLHGR